MVSQELDSRIDYATGQQRGKHNRYLKYNKGALINLSLWVFPAFVLLVDLG
jgi:hypothetical protein